MRHSSKNPLKERDSSTPATTQESLPRHDPSTVPPETQTPQTPQTLPSPGTPQTRASSPDTGDETWFAPREGEISLIGIASAGVIVDVIVDVNTENCLRCRMDPSGCFLG